MSSSVSIQRLLFYNLVLAEIHRTDDPIPFREKALELGKQLAKKIQPELKDDSVISSHDSSSNGLINAYKEMMKKT